jgi:hypothetical protein
MSVNRLSTLVATFLALHLVRDRALPPALRDREVIHSRRA